MNLPFSPTFFRKIDIFQQLMDLEGEKNKKHLWEGVKAILVWGASEHHQHLGSSIDSNHVKNALTYCVKEKYITEEDRQRLVYSCRYILETLPVYGFGDVQETPDPKKPRVKMNRNGVLAGLVLIDSNFLKKTWWRYKFWIIVWWAILILAGILLFFQTVGAVRSIFVSDNPNQKEVNNYYPRRLHKPEFYGKNFR